MEPIDATRESMAATYESRRSHNCPEPGDDTQGLRHRIEFIGAQWAVTPYGYGEKPVSVHDTLREARDGLREAEEAVAA